MVGEGETFYSVFNVFKNIGQFKLIMILLHILTILLHMTLFYLYCYIYAIKYCDNRFEQY